jgi:regulatory subunit for Cdc7p protein kinase
MGMKIWALEKLQRMITAIHDPESFIILNYTARSHSIGGTGTRGRGETDLSQVLRNDRLNAPSDRDPSSWMKGMVMFKGPFIYIRDMEEKTRPAMVKEYPKVARRQDGAWPQFRSAPLGKCPFIDEQPSKRAQPEEDVTPAKSQLETEREAKHMDPPECKTQPKTNRQIEDDKIKRSQKDVGRHEKPPGVVSVRPASPRKSSESFIAPSLARSGPFHIGHEPAASGVQPSNITSAIRSQMISSTAAAPGAKAGVSKEVYELKRKVLVKSNSGISTGLMLSHQTMDAPQPTPSITKASRKKLPENLRHICEGGTANSEDNASKKQSTTNRDNKVQPKPKQEKRRDPRPGYCENCREKFDDFDEVRTVRYLVVLSVS